MNVKGLASNNKKVFLETLERIIVREAKSTGQQPRRIMKSLGSDLLTNRKWSGGGRHRALVSMEFQSMLTKLLRKAKKNGFKSIKKLEEFVYLGFEPGDTKRELEEEFEEINWILEGESLSAAREVSELLGGRQAAFKGKVKFRDVSGEMSKGSLEEAIVHGMWRFAHNDRNFYKYYMKRAEAV